jgi:hypothetical protein
VNTHPLSGNGPVARPEAPGGPGQRDWSKFEPGDRVCYSSAFLRSICDYSKESADQVGVVVAADYERERAILRVKWSEDWQVSAFARVFIHVDRKHLEPR